MFINVFCQKPVSISDRWKTQLPIRENTISPGFQVSLLSQPSLSEKSSSGINSGFKKSTLIFFSFHSKVFLLSVCFSVYTVLGNARTGNVFACSSAICDQLATELRLYAWTACTNLTDKHEVCPKDPPEASQKKRKKEKKNEHGCSSASLLCWSVEQPQRKQWAHAATLKHALELNSVKVTTKIWVCNILFNPVWVLKEIFILMTLHIVIQIINSVYSRSYFAIKHCKLHFGCADFHWTCIVYFHFPVCDLLFSPKCNNISERVSGLVASSGDSHIGGEREDEIAIVRAKSSQNSPRNGLDIADGCYVSIKACESRG